MLIRPPSIDSRTPAEIAEQTHQLLIHYLGSKYGWSTGHDGGEAGRALVGVFAHYCGLVVDRINRAPEKNFLAFLDLLGNVLTPPQPAKVPLSFALDDAAPLGCAVVGGTQVQAEVDGGDEPVVFETARDLWVSNFELQALVRVPVVGATELDVTWLIRHPARTINRMGPPERIFDQFETIYFGLQLTEGRPFEPRRPLTVHFFIDDATYESSVRRAESSSQVRVTWEYSAGTQPEKWNTLVVEDDTQGLTQAGVIELLVPEDFVPVQRRNFQRKMHWLRARLVDATQGNCIYEPAPPLSGVALNTVSAQNAVTVRKEVLGGSDGNSDQVFTAFRKPLLPGQQVEVQELQVAGSSTGGIRSETWVPWTEVSDFYASKPSDRHYVVNRQTGELRFGDGVRGKIPPPGVRNLRLAAYRTGGGVIGNVPVGALQTLLAANRLVAKVSNLAAAQGGADSETDTSLLERAPRVLRHRGRAVTDEDIEDLTKLASADVARALCVPLIDLAQNPSKVIATTEDELAGAGLTSVIIVPRSKAEKPLPSQALLHQVRDKLLQHCPATAMLSVVGPLYLRVDVKVEVVLTAMRFEERVTRQLRALFRSYLHPLTGRDGLGWPFGRAPQASDFQRLLTNVEGVHHASSLTVTAWAEETPFDYNGTEPLTCIQNTGRFLVCSGRHDIGVTPLT